MTYHFVDHVDKEVADTAYKGITGNSNGEFFLRMILGEAAIATPSSFVRRIFCLDERNSIVGAVQYYLSDEYMMLDTLSVLPQHQAHGIGNALLNAVVEKAKTSGAKKVELHPYVDAFGYYLKKGFIWDGSNMVLHIEPDRTLSLKDIFEKLYEWFSEALDMPYVDEKTIHTVFSYLESIESKAILSGWQTPVYA